MVNVLVVGATGFLGNSIAKEAAKKGHKVTALVSSESQSKKKEARKLEERRHRDCHRQPGVRPRTSSLICSRPSRW